MIPTGITSELVRCIDLLNDSCSSREVQVLAAEVVEYSEVPAHVDLPSKIVYAVGCLGYPNTNF